MISNETNGAGDYTLYDGSKYYSHYSFVKMNNYLSGYPPLRGLSGSSHTRDEGFYKQFTWYDNELRDGRAWSDWIYEPETPTQPSYTRFGPYNYPLSYILEAGW